jgi:hypothetical protein
MVLKRQMLAIQDVYVPVKRRPTLDPQKVEALAESMLAKGQETPILVRPDGTRFVLVEGLASARSLQGSWRDDSAAYLVQARKH